MQYNLCIFHMCHKQYIWAIYGHMLANLCHKLAVLTLRRTQSKTRGFEFGFAGITRYPNPSRLCAVSTTPIDFCQGCAAPREAIPQRLALRLEHYTCKACGRAWTRR